MPIGRRTFLLGTGLVAAAPVLATVVSLVPTALTQAWPQPNPMPSRVAANETGVNSVVFEIDGWNCRKNTSRGGSTTASLDSSTDDIVGERVLISINQSWRAAWR